MFNQKKKFFKRQIQGTEAKIWVTEFSIYKKLQLREAVRKEYDMARSRLESLVKTIESEETKKLSQDEQNRLKDQKELLERDINKLKDQIDGLDIEVNGTTPNEKYREGVQGEMQVLDMYRELIVQLKDYMNKVL